LLYAFSWYNGKSTVSLLDTDCISKWQYSTPDGDRDYSSMIAYKEIDYLTDMIVATSGNSYINYNRLISSSTSPYSVTESATFRDPTESTTRRLYAIHIID
jgi:hypothetical protein